MEEDKKEMKEEELKEVSGGNISLFDMYCPHCKEHIEIDDSVCPYCGQHI